MLPDATLRGMRSSRSHGGIAPTVAGWSLLSEASSPGSAPPCREWRAGRGADTPACEWRRVGIVATRTAPAFGRPFAPRYGSDLLTLRLLWLCSWVTCFQAAQSRRFASFARLGRSPRSRFLCAPCPSPDRAFWRGGPAGKRNRVLVCAVAAITLWVTASACGSKLPITPDSACPRFLIAASRSAPETCR